MTTYQNSLHPIPGSMQKAIGKRPRILLSGVFGPFGVDDEFGRAKNIMELFHNQVTKAQGLASIRFHHRSFGLYFMAANVDADVTVLDFPSRRRFEKEVKKGYDMVGISFIVPNFIKAKEMSRICRQYAPNSEIILGGHGAAIEGVEDLIDCDFVAKGEGIRWLREHLGQNPDAPIVHPTLPASDWQTIFGVPVPGKTNNLLVPGVGCVNACNFCATSHFFGKSYTAFLRTGKEIFDICCKISDERGTDNFFVMDENFLKDKERALALIDEMERHHRYFNFYLFSSAETISRIGVENMIRLGVIFVWIGFESKSRQENYEKNAGVEGRDLVASLRDAGISVLASGILCLEEHTPENIQTDIDFMIDLGADLVQFMLYLPLPVTALYLRIKEKGLLLEDMPFELWHGQEVLNWTHPAFPGTMPEEFLMKAFSEEFETNLSSIYRMIETAYRGYKTLDRRNQLDDNLTRRKAQMKQRTGEYRLMLDILASHGESQRQRDAAFELQKQITRDIGPVSLGGKMQIAAGKVLASLWKARVALFGDMRQPRTIVTRYNHAAKNQSRQTAAPTASALKDAVIEAIPKSAAARIRV